MRLHATFHGALTLYRCAGSEIYQWALRCRPRREHDALVDDEYLLLQEGDLLSIWNENNRLSFTATIRPDRHSDWWPHEEQSSYVRRWLAVRFGRLSLTKQLIARSFLKGMPRVCGRRVLWTQRGIASEQWMRYFYPGEKHPPFQAQVLRPLHVAPRDEEDS